MEKERGIVIVKEEPSKLKTILGIVLVLIIFSIMFYVYLDERDARIEKENLIEASTDELIKWRNKDGENLAKIRVLETENTKTFLAFKSKDSTIQELQALVSKYKKSMKDGKGSASVIKKDTKVDTIIKTVETKDSITGSPIYSAKVRNRWYTAETIATKDSTKISFETYHTISLVITSESQGLFKKRKTYAIASDSNPYSDIKDLRVYNVTESKKRFVVGPYVGVGISTNNSQVFTSFQVGVGVTYKLLEF